VEGLSLMNVRVKVKKAMERAMPKKSESTTGIERKVGSDDIVARDGERECSRWGKRKRAKQIRGGSILPFEGYDFFTLLQGRAGMLVHMTLVLPCCVFWQRQSDSAQEEEEP
jgi:hypothetical protein